jgi:hypothetical protein
MTDFRTLGQPLLEERKKVLPSACKTKGQYTQLAGTWRLNVWGCAENAAHALHWNKNIGHILLNKRRSWTLTYVN